MPIYSVYPIENYNRGMGAIQILPVLCSPLIEVALYTYICKKPPERFPISFKLVTNEDYISEIY